MANDDFSEPPRRADSKNPIFFFPRFLGLGHLQGPGVRLGRILGVLSIEPFLGEGGVRPEGSIDPPPPGNENPASQIAQMAPSTAGRPAGHSCLSGSPASRAERAVAGPDRMPLGEPAPGLLLTTRRHWRGGGLAQGHGVALFAFGGVYWPLHILTLCGSERALVVSTEPRMTCPV